MSPRRAVDKQPRGRAFGFILKLVWTQPSSLAYTHIHFLHRPLSPAPQLIHHALLRTSQEMCRRDWCRWGWKKPMFVMDGDLTAWKRKRTKGETFSREERETNVRDVNCLCSHMSVLAVPRCSRLSPASQLVLIKICKWRRTADLKSVPPGDLDQCGHGSRKLPGFSLGQWRGYSCFLKRPAWDGFNGFIHLLLRQTHLRPFFG